MTSVATIDSIKKTAKASSHERITHFGGINPDGSHWRISQRKAIAAIESGVWAFNTNVFGKTLDVIIGITEAGDKYLKAENDDKQPNSLLSLNTFT